MDQLPTIKNKCKSKWQLIKMQISAISRVLLQPPMAFIITYVQVSIEI